MIGGWERRRENLQRERGYESRCVRGEVGKGEIDRGMGSRVGSIRRGCKGRGREIWKEEGFHTDPHSSSLPFSLIQSSSEGRRVEK